MDQIIDTSKTYTLTNAFANAGLVLAVTGDNSTTLSMVNATEASANGQWFLTRVNGNQPGIFFRVHPASMGLDHSIDVVNKGGAVTSKQLTMARSGDSSGQAWRFNLWSDKATDGYRLSNKLSGTDVHLDVDASRDAQLMGGDFPGQHWMMVPVGGITASEADTAGGADDGSLLTESGIIGLSVSAALGFGLLFLLLLVWLVRCSQRRRRARRAMVDFKADALRLETAQGYAAGTVYGVYKV